MKFAIAMLPVVGAAALVLQAASPMARNSTAAAYYRLPLSFEANVGQADSAVRFLWRSNHGSLMLTASGAMLSLPGGTLRFRLAGARSSPEVSGLDKLPGKVNYFLGADPKLWRTNIPVYAKVRYHDVYPGVDLVYYGKENRLEYDFIVAPGADPAAIRLAFDGADSVDINAAGDLRLRVRKSEIQMRKPVVYQETSTGRRVLDGEYTLTGPRQIAFQLHAYDPAQPLVIDPVLDYASYLGGDGYEGANAMAVDADGAVYMAGFAGSPAGFPILNPLPDSSGWRGAFVTKLSPSGALVYSTYLGGRDSLGGTAANGIAVDGSGAAYVTGVTGAGDFPTRNPIQKSLSGRSNLFVAKLSVTGSALIYSTYLGGGGDNYGNAIAVDASGSAYVAGQSDPHPQGGYVFSDRSNAFVARLNPAGSALVYSLDLGGSLSDRATGIAVDPQGNAYVTGATSSNNFPTLNALQPFSSVASTYRTNDGGTTWARSDAGLATSVFLIAIDPQTPSTIYAAGERGIFKSIDGGDTWRGVNNGISDLNILIAGLTIDPGSPATLYAVTSAGGLLDPPAAVYKTVNGGDTWREISLYTASVGFRPAPIAVDPNNSAVLYSSNRAGVIKSTDGGANWRNVIGTGFATQVAIDGQNPATVYALQDSTRLIRTADGGDNWTSLDNAPGVIYAIAVDPVNPGVLYASSDAGMSKSADSGASWRNVLPAAVLPIFAGASLYAVTSDAVLISADAGETWKPAGFRMPSGLRNFVADPSRPGRFFVGGGGDSDAFLTKLNPAGRVLYSTYLGGSGGDTALAVAVDAPGNAYVTGSTASSDFAGVNSTRAPGDSKLDAFVAKVSPTGSELLYTIYLGGSGNDSGNAIAVDSAGNAYVAGSTDSGDFPTRSPSQSSLASGSIIKSSDGGAHWSASSAGLESSDFLVVIPVKDSSTVYAGGSSGVSVSQDRGRTWKPTSLKATIGILVADPHTPAIVYAAGGSIVGDYGLPGSPGIFQTTNGGATWHAINSGLTNLDVRTLAIDPATTSTLYAGTSAGIFRTTDSGLNWVAVNNAIVPVHSLAVSPTQPLVLYALGGEPTPPGQYGAAAAVFRSDDAGATWKTVHSAVVYQDLFYRYQPNALLVDPFVLSTVYLVTDSLILQSTDSGANWKPLQGPLAACRAHTLAIDSETASMLYAGGQNGGRGCLLKSSDGGESWNDAQNDVGLNVLALGAGSAEPGTLYATVQSGSDAFVAKLSADGSVVYSTYLGGGRGDSANAIVVDSSGNAWVAGTTTSVDFPTAGAFQPRLGGTGNDSADAFVVRLKDR